jgi:hypothetical protein
MGNREREQELATSVQATRGRLLELLTADEQRTEHRHGSELARTFEDHAREVADHTADPRSHKVFLALNEFQSCVNALWTHAIGMELPQKLAAGWFKKHRMLERGGMFRQDAEAEALMALRDFVIRFEPGQGASLETYATRGIHQRLTEWAAQQGAIELPRDEARVTGPEHFQRGLEGGQSGVDARGVHVQPELDLSFDPWPIVDRCLDEDLEHELESFEELCGVFDKHLDLRFACPGTDESFDCLDCPYKEQCDAEIEGRVAPFRFKFPEHCLDEYKSDCSDCPHEKACDAYFEELRTHN